jgi:meso-butanediol dehydrogenase / (S,S)-butanediol dehydrogenase / diacetyl reductase
VAGRALEGKVAVVTGAGSGIGRATAKRFGKEGAAVVVNDLNRDTAGETVTEILQAGGVATVHSGDVGDSGYVESLVSFTLQSHDRIDVMHNNAGYGLAGDVGDLEDDDFEEMIRVNLYSAVYGTRAALRPMIRQGAGSIINTASTAGFGAAAKRSSYGMAKAALINLTKSTAVDYARFGVRVNAICPGPIHTPALARFAPDLHYYESQIPMKRLGKPEDIAALAVFLASDESSFISGVAIFVDGAMMARLPAPFLTPDDVTGDYPS